VSSGRWRDAESSRRSLGAAVRVDVEEDTLQFSVFPSLLLVMTLVRLSLNALSTRLILLNGYAGKVIASFGDFVIGGSVIVGLVVFLILIVIQFAVVTKGAGRVAEVAARFTLDALPGKPMGIDADLNAGLIDEDQARAQRDRVAKEADFYGAMDGASKFVKGDVIAGVIIVLINLFGGFAVGFSQGISLTEAVSTYVTLTVGDGLVSQLLAILTSVAAGLLVTRVNGDANLGDEVAAQLFATRRALRLGGLVLAGMAFLPGLPILPFLGIGAVMWVLGSRLAAASAELDDEPVIELRDDGPTGICADIRVDTLELHLAYDVLDLVDETRGGDLLARVTGLRRQIARELGFVMPRHQILALPDGDGDGDGDALRLLGGTETVEAVFGPAAWGVPAHSADAAAAGGATVVDRSSVVVTHLAHLVRTHGDRLLGRQDVQELVEGLRHDHPILVKDIDNDVVPLGLLHRVL
jgi:flagellar biosynthesis protein FlhA